MQNLFIVMPVFNEQGAIDRVLKDWVSVLRQNVKDFRICVVNDGSTDQTPQRLSELQKELPELEVLHQQSMGHGGACIQGYRWALSEGADWVLQIDSDGQCDPQFLPALLEQQNHHEVIYGLRKRREDGWVRWCMSRGLTLLIWTLCGVWVRDPNVPYRLMKADPLRRSLSLLPEGTLFPNVLMAVAHKRRYSIRWVSITFRQRLAGGSHLKFRYLFPWALQLAGHLRELLHRDSALTN